MPRIKIDFDKLCGAFPEATKLKVLPRKKKKALKKKIGQMLIHLLSYESHQIFAQLLEETIYEETLSRMTIVSEKLETTKENIK